MYLPEYYSSEERQDIVEAFMAAKKLVSKTGAPYLKAEQQFICFALEASKHPGRGLAKKIVMHRIKGASKYCVKYCVTIEEYLRYVLGVNTSKCRDAVQEFRHRWLDALIEEFKP